MSASGDFDEPELSVEVIQQVVKHLDNKETLQKRSIFRLKGTDTNVEYCLETLEDGEPDFEGCTDFEVATALKRYIGENATPIFPYELFAEIMRVQQIAKPSARGPELKALLNKHTPKKSLEILELLIPLLRRVVDEQQSNSMGINSIGSCFGMYLLRPDPVELVSDPSERKAAREFTKDLVRWYDYLFKEKKIDLNNADRVWTRKRKRKTMQLLGKVKKSADGHFLIIDNKLEIKVDSPKKRKKKGLFASGGTTTYRTSYGKNKARRSYEQFEHLHFFLKQNFSSLKINDLPSKPKSGKFSGKSADQKAKLMADLAAWLKSVCTHIELFQDSLFTDRWLEFFGVTDDKDAASSSAAAAASVTTSVSEKRDSVDTVASTGLGSARTRRTRRKPARTAGVSVAQQMSLSSGASQPSTRPVKNRGGRNTRSKQFKKDELLAAGIKNTESTTAIDQKQTEALNQQMDRKAKRDARIAQLRRAREQRKKAGK